MKKQEINRFFEEINNKTCLVIGDLMLDSYRWGKVDRISPEAPVPIISIDSIEDRLGGAANVALNLNSLGAKTILCGVVGNDDSGKILKSLLDDKSMSLEGIYSSDFRKTSVKTRIISGSHHLLRMDEEDCFDLSKNEESEFLSIVKSIINSNSIDVIIFEDYDKGLLNQEIIQQLIHFAKSKNIPVTVDPKKKNFSNYQGATLFKPNRKELLEGLKIDYKPSKDQYISICKSFLKEQSIQSILLTLSEDGVLITDETNNSYLDPAYKRDISDVSGAGDTVISVASLALASGLDLKLIASLSNLAGGLVCEKVGVVAIDKDQLHNEAIKQLID